MKATRLVLLVIALGSWVTGASGQNQWIGGYLANWSDPANWSLGLPAANDDVWILGGYDLVLLDTSPTIHSLALGGSNSYGSIWDSNGTRQSLTLTGALTLGTYGDLSLRNGTDLTVGGDSNIDGSMELGTTSVASFAKNLTNSGWIDVWNSSLDVTGTFTNSGTFMLTYYAGGPATTVNLGSLVVNSGSSISVGAGTTLNLMIQPTGITDIPAGTRFYIAGDFTAGGQNALSNLTSIEGSLSIMNGQTTQLNPGGSLLSVSNSGQFGVTQSSNITIAGDLFNNGTLQVGFGWPDSDRLTVLGSLTNAVGASFFINSSGDAVNAGSFSNFGSLSIANGARLDIGNSISQIPSKATYWIGGDFTSGNAEALGSLNFSGGGLYYTNAHGNTITPQGGTLTLTNTSWLDVDNLSSLTITGSVDNNSFLTTSGWGLGGSNTLVITNRLTNESTGWIRILDPQDVFSVGSFYNYGMLELLPGATMNLTNQPGGITDVAAGSTYHIEGSFIDTTLNRSAFASLTSIGGTVELWDGQTTSIDPVGGQLTNSGTLFVSAGSTVQVNGAFINAGLVRAGYTGGPPSTLAVNGILSNSQSGTLSLFAPDGVAKAVTLNNAGNILMDWGAQLNVANDMTNAGALHTDFLGFGGSVVNVSGNLINNPGAYFGLNGSGDFAQIGTLNNMGTVAVGGGATLNLTNQPNGITDIVAGSMFDIAGTFTAGANNALYQLTSVEGKLILENGQFTDFAPIGGTMTIANTGEVHILSGSTYHVTGNVQNYGYLGFDPSTIIVTGTLTNEPGSTFTLGPGDVLQVGSLVNKGAFSIPDGAVFQSSYFASIGSTSVNPQATVLVGTGTAGSTGYYQLANGTLGEFIDASGFGVIVALNGAKINLDGALDVQLQAGFNPAIGTAYQFITFSPGDLTGTFASIQNAVFNNGTEKWIVLYNDSGGYVELLAQSTNQSTPEPTSFLLMGTGLLGLSFGMRRFAMR